MRKHFCGHTSNTSDFQTSSFQEAMCLVLILPFLQCYVTYNDIRLWFWLLYLYSSCSSLQTQSSAHTKYRHIFFSWFSCISGNVSLCLHSREAGINGPNPLLTALFSKFSQCIFQHKHQHQQTQSQREAALECGGHT